ncbi:acyltransferase family protein [Zhengella sp. ZM62]|uniref:acyltransferase family protein n=1 Tax=Zhengella sedimenti TaxID=3390035 RepID=UPI0039765491
MAQDTTAAAIVGQTCGPGHHALSGAPVQRVPMLDSIQYLRAIAAWLVVVYHVTASVAAETGQPVTWALGAVGVDIFFVLSGFLMAMIVDRGEPVDGRFVVRRVIRIAPLYYTMTIVLFVTALTWPWLLNTVKADWRHLLTSLLFLPSGGIGGGNQPILMLGWTLNYEMTFYLLVFAFVRWGGDRHLNGLAVFLAAVVLAGRWIGEAGMVLRFYTDPVILEFALGIIVYNATFRGRYAAQQGWLYWVALAAGVFLLWAGAGGEPHEWRFVVWGMPAALIVAGGVHVFTAHVGWLRRLGDWSYSTYLLHVYVIQALVKLVLPAAGLPVSSPLCVFLTVAPLVAAGSLVMYRWLEMPVMAWLGRRVAKRPER